MYIHVRMHVEDVLCIHYMYSPELTLTMEMDYKCTCSCTHVRMLIPGGASVQTKEQLLYNYKPRSVLIKVCLNPLMSMSVVLQFPHGRKVHIPFHYPLLVGFLSLCR